MADLLPLVQNYIGPIATPKHLNYYSALGLDELTEDRSSIAVAIENAIERLKRADRTQDPKGFEEVVKIVRQARVTLLDGEKKSTYDVQLKSVLRKVAPTVLGEDSQLLTESARLKELLPVGDPSSPFSLAAFLKSRPEDIPYETVAERHAALRPLLQATPAEVAVSRSLQNFREGNSLSPIPVQSKSINSVPQRISPSNVLQEELRRNRKQKNLITGGVAIGGACLFAGLALWMFLNSRAERVALMEKRNAAQNNAVQNSLATSEAGLTPVEGGKVKPVPERNRMNLGSVRGANSPPVDTTSPMKLPTIGAEEPPVELSDGQPVMMDAALPGEPTPVAEPIPEAMPDPTLPTMKPEEMVNTPAPEPEPEGANAWAVAMNKALEAIKKRKFDQFEPEIEKALSATQDPVKLKQTEKLNLIGQLVPMGAQAFQDGYGSLKSTNTLSLGGSNKANIVEAKPDLLVARIKGKNERMPIDQLPMELVLAIANMELSNTATDDAVRGAVLQWDPRATPESKASAKQYFDKAATKDPKFANLETVVDAVFQ